MRPGGICAAALLALALAACGGDNAAEEEPALPAALAEHLADESEEIADKLDAGDTCGAAQQADALKDEAQAAIDAGEVPAAFQSELMSTVDDLVNSVNCPETPPAPEQDCGALEERKRTLEEQKKDAKGIEKQKLETQIEDLEQRIKECKEGQGEEGDG